MANVVAKVGMLPVILSLPPVVSLTDDQLYELCQINRELRIERTPRGDRLIRPPSPDFVIELRSVPDRLSSLRAKMQEYLDHGALLGFLIDPEEKWVYVY